MQMEPTLSPEENQEEQPTTAAETPQNEASETAADAPKNEEKKGPTTPELNIEELSLEDYPAAIEKILKSDQWMKMGATVRSLQNSFDQKFLSVLQEKKEVFINEGGNEIDFFFNPDYKKNVVQLLREYRTRKSKHFKEQEAAQKANLNRKREIIEEIKQLIDDSVHDNNSYKQFKNLQEAFHNTGQVPRNESNNIWQTYKFHVERYYDFLHLNRDLREADFKHNYAERLKIVERTEALAELQDIPSAIRELNTLHRLWKNDLGPVAREQREELWSRFQAATKIIHGKKNEYNKNIDEIQANNRAQKEELLALIEKEIEQAPQNHNAWQNSMRKVNELKEKFQAVGRAPKADNKRMWNRFREVSRNYNHAKNLFYKQHKQQERTYVEAKKALIAEVATILEDPNWRDYVGRMKSVQNDWKKTGRISRRLSNKLWEEFKGLTNLYFDRLKNKVEALSAEDQAKLAAQNNFVDELIKKEAPTTPKKLAQFIDEQVEQWLNLEPQSKSPAQKKMLDHLVGLWEATSLSKKEKRAQQFATQLSCIKHDAEGLNKEHSTLKRQLEDIANELIQLENNLQFFNSSSDDNPMLKEVNKKIEQLNQQKTALEEKANAIKSLKRALNKQHQAQEEEQEQEEETAEE